MPYTSNIFPIDTNHQNSPFYITAITYRKYVHSTLLSQAKEHSIISSTFTTIKNLLNTIITVDVNAYLPLWYFPTEDHKGEVVEDILLNSNYVTLDINTPTLLPPNQTQQPISSDITTASTDLNDYTRWQTIYSLILH